MEQTFNELEISEQVKKALLDMGFSTPTPIQSEVIPVFLTGKDILAQAPTGTGKTCAFGIPALNMVSARADYTQVLILCPTRELVMQTAEELKKLGKFTEGVRILPIYGGQNIQKQLSGLRRRPQIVVGTPGRIMDHLRRRTLKLDGLEILVLDEADEMLNMGFREDIDVILLSARHDKQTVLFSATLPREIVTISKNYQTDPVSIKVLREEQELPPITQFVVRVRQGDKLGALDALLRENMYELSLVFTNTKRGADMVAGKLVELGYAAEALHGDLRQSARDRIMKKYRGGELSVLVATDVAARGIDVDDIQAVFNFDVPTDKEYYVHRIGRTARAGREGVSYTFATETQRRDIKELELLTGSAMTEVTLSRFTPIKPDRIKAKPAAQYEKKKQPQEQEKPFTARPYRGKPGGRNRTAVQPATERAGNKGNGGERSEADKPYAKSGRPPYEARRKRGDTAAGSKNGKPAFTPFKGKKKAKKKFY